MTLDDARRTLRLYDAEPRIEHDGALHRATADAVSLDDRNETRTRIEATGVTRDDALIALATLARKRHHEAQARVGLVRAWTIT